MADDSNAPVRLGKSYIKPAAEVLAREFRDDPLWAYFFPNAAGRSKRALPLFEFIVRYGVLYGEVYAPSAALEGVAVWLSSKKADPSPWGMLRSGAISLPFRMSLGGIGRMMRLGRYVAAMHRRVAPFPHQCLQFVGVGLAFQGKGYAGALLKPIFARNDAEGLPCYLETQNPENVLIYRHYGFEVAEKGIIPGTKVGQWAMLRQPVGP
jgi:GNAT superfamily N-acetyltransferase